MARTTTIPTPKPLDELEREYDALRDELAGTRERYRQLRDKRRELFRTKGATPADLDDLAASIRDVEQLIADLESACDDLAPEVQAGRVLHDRRNNIADLIVTAEIEVTGCDLVMQVAAKMGEIRDLIARIYAVRGRPPHEVMYRGGYGGPRFQELQLLAFHNWHPRNGSVVDELAGNLERARRDLADLRAEAAQLGVTAPARR